MEVHFFREYAVDILNGQIRHLQNHLHWDTPRLKELEIFASKN
jgi:hypothetical protein